MIGFVLTSSGSVPASWIDSNGHMNVAWYTSIFDEACKAMLARFGLVIGQSTGQRISVVASRMNLAFRKELLLGEVWQLWSGGLSVGSGCLALTHRLMSEGCNRASCDVQLLAFDLDHRVPTSLPNAVRQLAEASRLIGIADPFVTSRSCGVVHGPA